MVLIDILLWILLNAIAVWYLITPKLSDMLTYKWWLLQVVPILLNFWNSWFPPCQPDYLPVYYLINNTKIIKLVYGFLLILNKIILFADFHASKISKAMIFFLTETYSTRTDSTITNYPWKGIVYCVYVCLSVCICLSIHPSIFIHISPPPFLPPTLPRSSFIHPSAKLVRWHFYRLWKATISSFDIKH